MWTFPGSSGDSSERGQCLREEWLSGPRGNEISPGALTFAKASASLSLAGKWQSLRRRGTTWSRPWWGRALGLQRKDTAKQTHGTRRCVWLQHQTSLELQSPLALGQANPRSQSMLDFRKEFSAHLLWAHGGSTAYGPVMPGGAWGGGGGLCPRDVPASADTSGT